MNYQQEESIRNLNAALQQCLQAFPGDSGYHIIQDTVRKAINNPPQPQQSFPTPACIQTEEESKHFDQLRNFIDNLVLTVSPTGLGSSTNSNMNQNPSSGFDPPNKRKSLDEPTGEKQSRRKLSEAEKEAARGLQELSAGV